MRGDQVAGLIDFYFACTDIRAYDLAVTHSAWAFETDGTPADPAVGRALIAGYESVLRLTDPERAALPVLARGSCIRFALTRAWRSEEHTSELQSLMRLSYAAFCLTKKLVCTHIRYKHFIYLIPV